LSFLGISLAAQEQSKHQEVGKVASNFNYIF